MLIAEDNVVNQRVATKFIEKLGCRVDVVANGLEAVEAAERLRYDLILMDVQMPEMDGFAATSDPPEAGQRKPGPHRRPHRQRPGRRPRALSGCRDG